MQVPLIISLFACVLALSGCDASPAAKKGSQISSGQIVWHEGAVDDAFAEAKAEHKNVLLYWGAKWCPPCQLMQTTLFRDPRFIAQTRNFVSVHLDGDTRGAQVWGDRLNVHDYPAVLVLTPDLVEVTRLHGTSTSARLTDALRVASKRTVGTATALHKAAANPHSLSQDDWRLLSEYDFLDPSDRLGSTRQKADLARRLAAAAPDSAMQRHLGLQALLLENETHDTTLPAAPQAQPISLIEEILAQPNEVLNNAFELTVLAPDFVKKLPDVSARQALEARFVPAMDRMATNPTASLTSRIYAIAPELSFAQAKSGGRIPRSLMAKLRERIAMVDRAAHTPGQRQQTMAYAGEFLAQAGDGEGAKRIWLAELPYAIGPSYYMVDLAKQAKHDGHVKDAIRWMKKAAESADGPATRLQWGLDYSTMVLDLTPNDSAAVLASATDVLNWTKSNSAGVGGRTQIAITKWWRLLEVWGRAHGRTAAINELKARAVTA